MKFIKENIGPSALILFLFFLIFVLPSFSFAAGETNVPAPDVSVKLNNPLGPTGPNSIQEFIRIFLVGILKIGMPVVALAVIYSGFLFVKAMGNPEEITKAKDALLYTLIGAAVLLGAWAIATLVADTVISLGK